MEYTHIQDCELSFETDEIHSSRVFAVIGGEEEGEILDGREFCGPAAEAERMNGEPSLNWWKQGLP